MLRFLRERKTLHTKAASLDQEHGKIEGEITDRKRTQKWIFLGGGKANTKTGFGTYFRYKQATQSIQLSVGAKRRGKKGVSKTEEGSLHFSKMGPPLTCFQPSHRTLLLRGGPEKTGWCKGSTWVWC